MRPHKNACLSCIFLAKPQKYCEILCVLFRYTYKKVCALTRTLVFLAFSSPNRKNTAKYFAFCLGIHTEKYAPFKERLSFLHFSRQTAKILRNTMRFVRLHAQSKKHKSALHLKKGIIKTLFA